MSRKKAMSKRVVNIDEWRRRERQQQPPKQQLYSSIDDLIAKRLREMRLPEPPPAFRERNRHTYREWLEQAGRNPWRS